MPRHRGAAVRAAKWHPCQPARGHPGRGAEAVAGNPNPATAGSASDDHGGDLRRDARQVAIAFNAADRADPDLTAALEPAVDAAGGSAVAGLDAAGRPAPVLTAAARGSTSAGRAANARNGDYHPRAASSNIDSSGGIASCSDRRTLACGSAVARVPSNARPGIVPGLARFGVAPRPSVPRCRGSRRGSRGSRASCRSRRRRRSAGRPAADPAAEVKSPDNGTSFAYSPIFTS